MKKYIILACFIIASTCNATEILRQRGVATYLAFPIVDSTGTYCTGVAGLDSEKSVWGDGGIPSAFVDCTNEATEIGTTGIYYLSLTAGECTTDYMMIQVKGTNVLTQGLLINFKPYSALTGGLVGGVTVYQNLDKTGYTASTVSDKTGYTVSTVSDKTGYTVSTVQDKTGYSATLTEYVTAYKLLNNNDKTGYTASTVSDKTGYTVSTVSDKTGYQLVGGVTVYANNDKTGYTVSTVQDKTGYSVDAGTVTIRGTKKTLDTLNDASAGSVATAVWGTATKEITGGVITTNNDKSGYQLIGGVTVYANNDKSGYALTQTFPTNFSTLSIDGTGKVTTTAGTSAPTAYENAEAIWSMFDSSWSARTDTMGYKIYNLPTSGTGDWTVSEKALIKSALSIEGSTPSVTMDKMQKLIKAR